MAQIAPNLDELGEREIRGNYGKFSPKWLFPKWKTPCGSEIDFTTKSAIGNCGYLQCTIKSHGKSRKLSSTSTHFRGIERANKKASCQGLFDN